MFAKIFLLLFMLVVAGTAAENVKKSISSDGQTDRYPELQGATDNSQTAEDGFRSDYKYFPAASGWFKYHDVPSHWRDARLRCQLEGAVLASPLNREISRVMSTLAGDNMIYTGIHDLFSSRDYFSIEGVPLSKVLQDGGVPQDLQEYSYHKQLAPCQGVVLYKSHLVFDVKCGDAKPYICYKQDLYRNLTVNECGTIDNEYELSNETGKCYKFHRTPRTWSRAYMACAAEGGHLAIINSQEEADVLSKLYNSMPLKEITNLRRGEGYYAFVGFHDWGEHGDFMTIHGETFQEAGYTKWITGEPNNVTGAHTKYVGEYCGSINRAAQLNDLWCDYVTSFICEKDPNSLQN